MRSRNSGRLGRGVFMLLLGTSALAAQPAKLSLVDTVKTESGAKTMGFDAKTHNLYLTTADFNPPVAPTEKQPNPQPTPIPGTFRLLIYGR